MTNRPEPSPPLEPGSPSALPPASPRSLSAPLERGSPSASRPASPRSASPLPPAPWPLPANRVPRFYRGGALLDEFRGIPAADAVDGDEPEDWLGSAVAAWTPPGRPPGDLGLSRIETSTGAVTIAELLGAHPAAVGGPDLIERAGPTTGVLVKLLDAAERLPVHAHPSRRFARAHLGSFFGKAEAWIVLATRELVGVEPPNVRLGFRREVGRDELRRWIDDGDTESLLATMHARPAHPGDVWLVPPGLPHAIGAGVLIAEVQEPTDFSIVAETAGVPIEPEDAHLRLGWDVAIDAFDRTGWSDHAIDGLRQPHEALAVEGDGRRIGLLGAAAAPYFRAERLAVTEPGGRLRVRWDAGYTIAIVTTGAGTIATRDGEVKARRGQAFALPAVAAAGTEITATAVDGIEIVACRAPDPGGVE